MTDPREAELLRIAPQVENFLRSDAADVAFTEIDRRYFAEFKQADTEAERLAAWAKSRALQDVRVALQAIADTATLLQHRAERANAATG